MPITVFRDWLVDAARLGAMISFAFPKPPKGSFFGSLVLVADGFKVVCVGSGLDVVVGGGGDNVRESLGVGDERVVVVSLVVVRCTVNVRVVTGSSVCVCVVPGCLVSVAGGVFEGRAEVRF